MWGVHDGMGWWMVFGAAIWLLFWGSVVYLAVLASRRADDRGEPSAQPAQLPPTGAGDSGGGGTPVWPVAAALAGVAAMLLGGVAVWRRRRA
jgi:hypothetical protein